MLLKPGAPLKESIAKNLRNWVLRLFQASFFLIPRYSEILDSGPKHKYNSTLYLPYSSSDTSDNLSDENSGGSLTLSSQDVRKIETSIRGHKSRIYVCKCMANLYSCPKLNLCHEDYNSKR